MKREYPESPLVGVGAVIVQNHGVLLILRGQPPLLGEWSLPGGVLECGETLREAVVREAREETGLAIEVGEMLGVYERLISCVVPLAAISTRGATRLTFAGSCATNCPR
jgi:8-oxo-dGTP diphosphatase